MNNVHTPKQRVSILPGPAVLSVLRHLNYKPWFALAEFVDNALQSYHANRTTLHALHGPKWRLSVSINIDNASPARISIRDNAAGIFGADFPRAFRPAVVPPDASGLSEFGMGMKSAACWFSPRWHVRTKALGEMMVRTVRFDVVRIVNDAIEELEIDDSPARVEMHFTEIVLDDPHHVPVGRTLGKIKDHLTDIYRVFVRNGTLELRFNDDLLVYEEPTILSAPYERDPSSGIRLWKKDIDFPLGGGQTVKGFAALRDPGNHAKSGFALFRRGRLIEGSGEDGYRPPFIFGSAGSFRHLRLFGELHLEGFEVSHTKDGFRWDEDEEPFLQLLKEHLDSDELPLLRQADAFRALASKRDRSRVASEALTRAADAMQSSLPEALPKVADAELVETNSEVLAPQPMLAERELQFDFRGKQWIVRIILSDDPAEGDWLTISDRSASDDRSETLEIRIAMAHPFMVAFGQTRSDEVEALIRIGAAMAISEKLARRSGVKYAGTIRRNFNEILREALSKP
jgi:hypothetical protein